MLPTGILGAERGDSQPWRSQLPSALHPECAPIAESPRWAPCCCKQKLASGHSAACSGSEGRGKVVPHRCPRPGRPRCSLELCTAACHQWSRQHRAQCARCLASPVRWLLQLSPKLHDQQLVATTIFAVLAVLNDRGEGEGGRVDFSFASHRLPKQHACCQLLVDWCRKPSSSCSCRSSRRGGERVISAAYAVGRRNVTCNISAKCQR